MKNKSVEEEILYLAHVAKVAKIKNDMLAYERTMIQKQNMLMHGLLRGQNET